MSLPNLEITKINGGCKGLIEKTLTTKTQNVPKPISTKLAPEPVGPYNQAISAGGWLYCSGQIALDPETGLMTGNKDVIAETKQVLKNLLAVLNEAGASSANVVKTTIYLSDLGDFEKVSHANNLTKNITTSERIIVEDFNVTSSVTVQSTSRHSSSSSSSFEQATKEGGSDLDPNQGIKY